MVLEHTFPCDRGLIYRLRYRAMNGVGWGEYSDTLSALCAEPPRPPSAPTLASATGTSMELKFEESEDDGGSRISSYELYWSSNYQAAEPTFTKVTGYTNNQMGYTLTDHLDTLVSS